jgi:predicted ATPase
MDRGGRVGDLVERRAELDRLVSAVDAVANGAARVVAVRGEPGIGKTRLLRELGRVAGPGRTVCWGRATEFEQQVPFGVFANALGAAAAAVEPARLERLTADQRGLVHTIFPTLPVGALGAPMLQVVDLERFRLYRAVRALLEAIAGPGGLVLVLDDMHWADNGSIELCEHVLRNPPSAPLAVVMAYRPRQLSPRLTAALQAAVAHGAAEAIDVGPLTLDGTAQMVGDRVGAAALRQLHRRSGGNPFYLETLMRSESAERPANQPHSVHLALSAELAALNPTQSAVAHAGAVVGDTFEPDVVAEVAGMAIDAVLSATDGLVRATWSGRPGTAPASSSATRSCGRRRTKAPAPVGGWRPTGAPRPHSPGAVLRSSCVRIM